MNGYLLLMFAMVGTSAGQIFVKVGSRRTANKPLLRILLCPHLYFGFLCISTVPFVVNLAMDTIELSLVFAFSGLYQITVPLSAKVFLKEEISRTMVLGMMLITLGIIVYHL